MEFKIDVEVDHWIEGANLVTAIDDGIRQRQSLYDLIYESYSHLEDQEPTYEETIDLDDLKTELQDALSYIKALQEGEA